MNRKRKNLIAIIVMIIALMAPMFGMVASASTPAHPGIADQTTQRYITIWKYVLDNLQDAGGRGDGTQITPPGEAERFVPSNPLYGGVQFQIQRVIPSPGVALVDPRFQTQANGDWTLCPTFPTQVITTDIAPGANQGRARINLGTPSNPAFPAALTSDGIYLITELSHPDIVRPVDPFFVHVPQTRRAGTGALTTLIYDIHVQPKNVPFSSLNPVKSINDATHNTHIAGNVFRWELQVDVPADLTTVMPEDGYLTRTIRGPAGHLISQTIPVVEDQVITADFLEIRDVFNTNLNVVMAPLASPPALVAGAAPSMQGRLAGPTPGTFGPWVNLPSTYFTVTVNPTNDNDLTFALTPLGMERIGHVLGYAQIRALVYTYANPGFNGVIDNTFTVQYNGPDWRLEYGPGNFPPDPESPEDPYDLPIYYTGGFRILKHGPTGAPLAGAVFRIATCIWNVDAAGNREGDLPAHTGLYNANRGYFLASDGVHRPHTATLPTGVTWLEVTTDATGQIAFNGLPLAPHLVGLGFAPPVTDANYTLLNRAYYLVEIAAPTGYELLRAPHRVVVNTRTHLDDFTVMDPIVNQRITDLPFTGGMGTVLIVIIAMSVIGLSVVLYGVDKRRRRG